MRHAYDVFVSFSSEDRGWVTENLLPMLKQQKLTHYVMDERADQFLLSLEIRTALARSRWVLAVSTPSYDRSVFTFFESRTAREDGVLVVIDRGGEIDRNELPPESIFDMWAAEGNDELAKRLKRQLPEDVTERRAPKASRLLTQYQTAEKRFRRHWDLYKKEIVGRDFEAAFRRLRRSLFIPLHYRYGDYMANADLLGAYAKVTETGASPIKGRSPRLLTGSVLFGTGAGTSEQPEAWIATARGVTYRATWDIGQATKCFETARRIYESSGDTSGVVLSLINLADVAWESGRITDACAKLQQALELLRREPNRELRAIVHQDLLLRLTYAADFEGAARNRHAALHYRGLNDKRRSIIRANCARQSLLLCRDDRAARGGVATFVSSEFATDARKHAERCAELSGRGQVQRNRVRASWLLGAASLALGRHDDARSELQAALERCRRIAIVEFEADILLSLARCELELKNVLRAAELARAAQRLAAKTQRKLQECDANVLLLAIAVRQDDKPSVERLSRAANELLDRIEPGGKGHVIARREIDALVDPAR
ncbi:MAG: tetratricopeptide repeat protein [Acidobacteriota bacterium]